MWQTMGEYVDHLRATISRFYEEGLGDRFESLYYIEHVHELDGVVYYGVLQAARQQGLATWIASEGEKRHREELAITERTVARLWNRTIDLPAFRQGSRIDYFLKDCSMAFAPCDHHVVGTIFNDEGKLFSHVSRFSAEADQEVDAWFQSVCETMPTGIRRIYDARQLLDPGTKHASTSPDQHLPG